MDKIDGDVDLEGSEIDKIPLDKNYDGSVRTFFIFMDLPQHLEFRVANMPLMVVKTEIELGIALKNPRNPRKTLRIQGPYVVTRRVFRYSSTRPSSMGLSQYLELTPGPLSK